MVKPGKTPLRWMILGWSLKTLVSIFLAVVCLVVLFFLSNDLGGSTKDSLDQSALLRDVAEPITLIRGSGEAVSDSVWMGVSFADRNHVQRSAKWITTSYPGREIHDSLMLGKSIVPARGPDERAFLGLLQRWYRQDIEAQILSDPTKRIPFSELTEPQQAKVIGAAIMTRLLR